MKRINGWVAAALIVAAVQLTGCQKRDAGHEMIHPAKVEKIKGSDVKRVTLTDRAMDRLDVHLSEVIEQQGSRKDSPQLSVPYGALLYDEKGTEWVYTSPEPRVFVRAKVDVDYIEGVRNSDTTGEGRKMVVFLNDGPPKGTKVVSVAVAELYGEEKGIGH